MHFPVILYVYICLGSPAISWLCHSHSCPNMHIANDDWLFPGWMDTQVGLPPDAKGEWAVDKILSHSGSKTNSTFEIKWKTGDVTWLPYYQITHLQALTDYLELLGKSRISKLPQWAGHPPWNDPQMFIGAVSVDQLSNHFCTSHILDSIKTHLQTTTDYLIAHFWSIISHSPSFVSPTIDIQSLTMPPHLLSSVSHPWFIHIAPTCHLIKDPGSKLQTTLHVEQIAEFLKFNEQVCKRGGISGLQSLPLEFTDFLITWNTGTYENNPWCISKVFLGEKINSNIV